MGYSSSLPIDEFRSVEMVLDDLCGVVLPPLVRSVDVVLAGRHGGRRARHLVPAEEG